MADEIKQIFGLDVSTALKNLEQLDSAFNKTFSAMGSNPNFEKFNNNSKGTIDNLRSMRDMAREAAIEMAKVGRVGPGGSGGGGGNRGSVARPKLLSGDEAGDALGSLLGDSEAKARIAGRAAADAGEAFKRGSGGVNAFAISFETLTRVMATQLIIRSLNQIRNAIEDSIGGFIEFNRSIAEIQTITDEPFQNLVANVRELSDEFNAPILDVAKAKYEALSNGFETAEESTQIVTAALKFAKVGIASTAESVDLLSTALNAYGNTAEHAETLSAKLFETIRVGRVVGSELANSFGRVAPFGKQVGASEDELLAAFSSITIGGVKANEAATQIRATISSLLKPSEAMKQALSSLGFESGEQIIGAKGFQGALLALKGSTDGSATALAKLFPNVRAIGGVFRETTTGLDIYQDHLKKIQESSSAILNQKFQIRIESDAEKVSANLNKLKNFFTVDLGEQLTNKLGSAFDKIGGVDTLINGMQEFVPTIILATGALTAMSAAATVAGFASRALSVDLVTLGANGTRSFNAMALAASTFKLAIVGIGALVLSYDFGKFLGQQIKDSIEAPRRELEETQKQFQQFQRDQREAANNLANIKTQAQGREVNDRLARIRKANNEETESARETNESLLTSNKDTLERLIAVRAKYATDLQRSATTAENDVIQSKKREVTGLAKLEDAQFDFSINRLQTRAKRQSDFFLESEKQANRALSLAGPAADALGSANLPDEKAAADSAFDRAESYAKAAVESARSAGNIVQEEQAANALFHILRLRNDAEKEYQSTRENAARREEAAAAVERSRVDRLNSKTKEFLKLSDLFDKNGSPLPDDKIAENKGKAKKLLEEIQGELFGPGTEFQFSDLISFDKLQKQLSQNVTQKEIAVLFEETPGNLESLHQKIQGDLKKFGPILVEIATDTSKLKGKSLKDAINEVESQNQERADRIPRLREVEAQKKSIADQMAGEIQSAELLLNQQKTFAERFFGQSHIKEDADPEVLKQNPSFQREVNVLKEYRKVGEDTQAMLEKIKATGSADSGQISSLQNRLSKVLGNKENITFGLEGERRAQALNDLREYVDLQEKRNALEQQFPGASQELQDISEAQSAQGFDAFIERATIERQEAERKAAEAARANQGAVNQLPSTLGTAVLSAEQYASAMERAARAAQSAVPPIGAFAGGSGFQGIGNDGSVYASTGGQIQYFDSGGMNRGIDTINAKLAPREVVMNQQASGRFFSQLQAMNAGINPSANRSSSGDTFQIGDITVNEAGNAQDTAREVINRMRREQRRGSGNSLRSK